MSGLLPFPSGGVAAAIPRGSVTLTGLFTAAVLAERDRACGHLKGAEGRLRRAEPAGGFGHWEMHKFRGSERCPEI